MAADGVGETDFALTGLARHQGYHYASTTTSTGTLDKDITYAEVTTQPFGREWYGGKTIYGVEVDGTAPRDLRVRVDSLKDYKGSYERGKEVALHKSGRTGYIQYGNEFKLSLIFESGVPKDLHISGVRVWLKLTDRRTLTTIPYFFGKHGLSATQYKG
jgi:hypothetical protein